DAGPGAGGGALGRTAAGFAGRRPVHRRTGQPPGAVVELRALPQRTGAGAGLLPAADGAAAEPRTLHRSGALRTRSAAEVISGRPEPRRRARRLLMTLTVAEAEQVEDAVQAEGGNGLLGRLLDQRLGAEGHAQAGQAEHRQVVGAVAHGDGLLQAQA